MADCIVRGWSSVRGSRGTEAAVLRAGQCDRASHFPHFGSSMLPEDARIPSNVERWRLALVPSARLT